jgi:hypothetical protein
MVDVAERPRFARRVARPVFLDRSGTRRRVLTVVAAALGVGLCGALTLLVLAFAGASPVSIPGFPQGHAVTGAPSAGPGARAGASLPIGTGDTAGTVPGRAASPTSAAVPSTTPLPTTTKPGHQVSHTPPHPTKSR